MKLLTSPVRSPVSGQGVGCRIREETGRHLDAAEERPGIRITTMRRPDTATTGHVPDAAVTG